VNPHFSYHGILSFVRWGRRRLGDSGFQAEDDLGEGRYLAGAGIRRVL